MIALLPPPHAACSFEGSEDSMRKSRVVLLACSLAVVLVLLGSGAALTAGAGEGTFKQMLVFSEVLSYVVDNYVDSVDTEKVMAGAYQGLMSGLDAHGAYLTKEEVAAWKQAPTGERGVGPGVSILKNGPVFQVVAVAPGSPAADAGIAVGDQIRKIGGRSVRAMSLDQAERLMGGASGSSVTLDLLRVKDLKREDVSVRRAPRKDPPFVLDLHGTVAVLRVRDMERLPTEALLAELDAIRGRGADRLLVDARDVAQSDTRSAVKVAEVFASGEFLKLKDRSGKAVETLSGSRPGAAWAGPIGVLVNGATAGAGEGLAIILHDRLKAPIYGESTYGLGTEVRLVELPEGDGLLVPGFVWEAATGTRWNGEGVAPDEVVKADTRTDDDEDEQLGQAVERFAKRATASTVPKAA
jgi:carboxyl-terminal processing protease